MVRADASYLLGFRDDPMGKVNSDNGDMWAECWKLILSKNIRLDVVKIPRSHATEAMEKAVEAKRKRVTTTQAEPKQ